MNFEIFPKVCEQRSQTSGVVEIFHQIFFSGGPDIGEHWRPARDLVEAFEAKRDAGATRHRDEMNNGIGRTRQRMDHGDCIVESLARQNVRRLEILPHHLDDAPSAHGCHARVIGVRRRNRGRARQRQPQRLGHRGHGGSRAHGHAVAGRARDALFDFAPRVLVDFSGAQLRPVLPGIAARTQRFAVPVAAQHRPRRHKNRGQIHAGRAHDERRRRLVATAHQHRAIDRVRTQQLLGFHRQQVAIEHGGRFLERFGQGDRRHLQRETAGLPYAALHFLGALAKMRVTGIDVAPGIDDRDHRLAGEILARVTHLQRARTMAERAQILGAEPAMAAQLVRLFTGTCHGGCNLRAG